jgi:septal ring factor EnvC (AmiA/AmiB activator)
MEATVKKGRPLIEPNVRHRLGRIGDLGVDVSAARAAYSAYGAAVEESRKAAAPAVESSALDSKRYALEQIGVQIKTLSMGGGTSDEIAELKEQRSALAAEIDAAESDREAIGENSADWARMLAGLRARAEKLELEALENCREKLAREVEAAVLAKPLCLRFPDQTPDEALRLWNVADEVERLFPMYAPRQNFLDLMAPEVAEALQKAP